MSTDPVVLITGATGDFGPHVVRAFAADGARLALTARKLEPAEALIRDLGLSADRALPSVVDVTSAASVAAWIEAVKQKWSRADVLVNIAGGYKPGKPVHEMDEADWDFMLNLNARSAFLTCRAVIPSTIDTPGNRAAQPDADTSKWVKPEDLAAVIVFLASEAANAIHGTLIPVYGRGG